MTVLLYALTFFAGVTAGALALALAVCAANADRAAERMFRERQATDSKETTA